MAVVQGIREKVHLPIYDSIHVERGAQLIDVENSSTLKFFVDVQRKTKLETNLQSASLLPHYNTFEARAMRVVISDLPPVYSEEVKVKIEDLEVLDSDGHSVSDVTARLETSLKRVMELLEEARDTETGETEIPADDEDVTLSDGSSGADQTVLLTVVDLEVAIEDLEKKAPAPEQLRPNNGAGTIISKFIYNTVTTLYVGEKIMIQMPPIPMKAAASIQWMKIPAGWNAGTTIQTRSTRCITRMPAATHARNCARCLMPRDNSNRKGRVK